MAAMAAQAPQLTVTVSHATGLRTTQMFGKQDPYVEVRCLETGEMRKTQTCEDGSKNPTWTQLAGCCVFRKTCPSNTREITLHFTVMNENKGTDSQIGTCQARVPYSVMDTGIIQADVVHRNKKAGKLFFRVNIDVDRSRANAGLSMFQAATAVSAAQGIRIMKNAPQSSAQTLYAPSGQAGTFPSANPSQQAPPPPSSLPSQQQTPISVTAVPVPPGDDGSATYITLAAPANGKINDMEMTNGTAIPLPTQAGDDYAVGLSWDFKDINRDGVGDTDLDLSAIVFGRRGEYLGAVYFNCLNMNGIQHSGDNRDGKGDGFDEHISLDLDQMTHSNVLAIFFMVTSFNGSNFGAVKTASAKVQSLTDGSTLSNVCLAVEDRSATSIIVGRVFCSRGQWFYDSISSCGHAKCFASNVPICQHLLLDLVPNLRIQKAPKSLMLTKGETLAVSGSQIRVGLGWDFVSRSIDLDASAVAFTRDGRLVEACFFGNLKACGKALQHQGDNTTGKGSGDDETIICHIGNMPRNVHSVCIVVNSFDGSQFSNIRNAYCRLLDSRGKETHRYNLSSMGNLTGLVVAVLHRMNRGWAIKAFGQPCKGCSYSESLPTLSTCASKC